MSDKPDKESQTEEASEKRLHDSIEKGDVPVSRDVSLFASLLGALLFFTFYLRSGAIGILAALQQLLDQAGQLRLAQGGDVSALLDSLLMVASGFILPAFILFIICGLAASFGQNAPRIIADRIMPKAERISLAGGWARIASSRGLTEFAKSLAKLFAVIAIAFFILRDEMSVALAMLYSDPYALGDHIVGLVVRLLAAICVATLLLAAFDLVWSRLHWKRDLRMSKQDVKDELKQMQGDPLIKARLRSLALERSRKRMMSAVPTATLVIANPTHYAIALRYVRAEGGAPKVVAKGMDLIALKIREIAEQNDIPVIEDKALARSMYDRVEVDMMIPAEFYRVIAELIHFLNSRSRA